jgi:hypothetical protein
LDEDTILAELEKFGNVTVCPGGVIHVNLAHLSLKFMPEDFVRLSDLIAKARGNFESRNPRPDGKPKLRVAPKPGDDEEPGDEGD